MENHDSYCVLEVVDHVVIRVGTSMSIHFVQVEKDDAYWSVRDSHELTSVKYFIRDLDLDKDYPCLKRDCRDGIQDGPRPMG